MIIKTPQRFARWSKAPAPARRAAVALLAALLAALLPLGATAEEGRDPDRVTAIVPADFPPQYLLDASGRPSGFAIDILEATAEIAGLRVRYRVEENFSQAVAALHAGQGELIPNSGITPERRKRSIFTTPVETFRIRAFKRADSPRLATLADIAQRSVVVVETNVGVQLMKDHPAPLLRVVESKEEAFFALISGGVDVWIYPEPPVTRMLIESNLEGKLVPFGEPLKEVKRGIRVINSRPELARRLDAAVVQLLKGERYREIYEKWHGHPTPYWTASRVAWLSALLMGLLVVVGSTLHLRALRHANRRLEERVQARTRSLRVSEENYRSIFNTAEDAFFIHDPANGAILEVNEATQRIFGYSEAELREMDVGEISDGSPPYAIEDAKEKIQKAFSDGVQQFEWRSKRKSGELFWSEVTLKVATLADDIRVVAVVRDIDQRKRAQIDQGRWHHVFENARWGMVVCQGEEGRFDTVNPEFARMHGFTPEELRGYCIADLFAPRERGKLPALLQRAFDEGYLSFDSVHLKKDGSPFPVHIDVTAVRKANGELDYRIASIVDITQRKQAEQQLLERETQFRSLFDNLSDGVIMADPEQATFLAANPSMSRMLDYSQAEMATMGIADIHAAEDLPRERGRFAEAARHERWFIPEVPMKRRDGGIFYADIHTFYTHYAGRRCLTGSFRDVTVRRELTRKLTELNRDLAERVEVEVARSRRKDRMLAEQARRAQMGEMLSMIAHQWRQPLTAISAAATQLKVKAALRGVSADDVDGMATAIERQTQHMSATITQFMEFFRPQRTAESFDVGEAMEIVRELVGAQLHHRGIRLEEAIPPGIVLSGNPKEFQQVLLNLVINARDAYETDPPQAPDIRVEARSTESGFEIFVEDRAGGISDEVMERVFDPYFTTKPQGKGSGLGLYLSKMIVEQSFGGTLSVARRDDGTRFVLSIPRAEP